MMSGITNDQKIITCITILLDLNPKIAPLRPHNPDTPAEESECLLAFISLWAFAFLGSCP
jgi:hypothetical protein